MAYRAQTGKNPPQAGDPQAAYRPINISDPGGKRKLIDCAPDVLSTPTRQARKPLFKSCTHNPGHKR